VTASAARDERALLIEARARQIKACRIADLLLVRGAEDADTVRALSPDQRRAIERDAGVRESSQATWEQVAVLVEHARHSAGGPVPLDLY